MSDRKIIEVRKGPVDLDQILNGRTFDSVIEKMNELKEKYTGRDIFSRSTLTTLMAKQILSCMNVDWKQIESTFLERKKKKMMIN